MKGGKLFAMTKDEKLKLELFHAKLRRIFFEMEDLADGIEAWFMKKTTQRSPEFRGGANC